MMKEDDNKLLKKLKRSEKRLDAAYKLVALGTWDWDLASNEQSWSDQSFEIMGLTPGQTVTRSLFESILHQDDRDYVAKTIAEGLTQDDDLTYGFRIIRPDGEVRHIFSHLTFELDDNGNKVRALGTNQDITEQKLAEIALKESEERLKAAQSLINLGCWDWDLISNKQVWSHETYRIFGVDPAEEATRELFDQLTHPDDRDYILELTSNALKEGADFTFESRIIRPDGAVRYVSTHVGIKSDDKGNRIRLLGTNQDITEQKTAEMRISHQAHHDPLTELANRTKLNQNLALALEQGQRYGRPFSILWVDLDYFKLINDTHGHLMGDTVLKVVAQRLSSQVRSNDLVARVGGDEFVVVLEDVGNPTTLELVARKILQALLEPILYDGISLEVGASLGGAIYPEHGEDVETLFKNADEALYRVKESGRNDYLLGQVNKGATDSDES